MVPLPSPFGTSVALLGVPGIELQGIEGRNALTQRRVQPA